MLNSIKNTNTLQFICNEVSEKYINWKIDKVEFINQDKVEISISDGNLFKVLRIDLSNKYSSLYLLKNEPKHKNSQIIFARLSGEKLISIKTLNYDRIVRIELSSHSVYLRLFGRGSSGIYIVANNKIVEYRGKEIDEEELLDPIDSINELILEKDPAKPPYRLTKELIKDYDTRRMELDKYYELIRSASFFYCYEDERKYFFSPLLLEGKEHIKESESPSEIVEYIVSRIKYQEKYEELYKSLINEATKRKRKLTGKVENFINNDKLIRNAELYRLYADLLISQPKTNDRNEEIELQDWEGNTHNIKLDEKTDLISNAQKYYEKSKKTLKSISEQEDMLPDLEVELEEAQSIISQIEERPRYKELEKIQKNTKWLQKQNYGKKKTEDKFRKFELAVGIYLYVGKSAANNDELTNHFAKPRDIWLHAKDVSGSHAVIKGVDADSIPKYLLDKSAEITAYYSSARNQSYVPVSYTQKKYVRKPKGAAVGAVIVTKEDVVFVEPGLPK
ncbi:MAG: NFACT family protein [Candidatus Kapaibacteriales bacterium]